MIFVRFQGKPFSITVIQAYAPTSNAEEAEVERFYESCIYSIIPRGLEWILFPTDLCSKILPIVVAKIVNGLLINVEQTKELLSIWYYFI